MAAARYLTYALVVALLLSACSIIEGDRADPGALEGPSTTLSLGEGVVLVKGIAYNPSRLVVPVRREVVWTIDDSGVSHTITADDKSFDSGRRSSGDFRRTFDEPGEFRYHCEVHARMKGIVVVF